MRRIFFVCSAVLLCAAAASAQKEKPWTEWTQKDAQKILTDSGWSQTQTELTDSSSSSSSAITKTESRNAATMDAAKNQESGETIGKTASLSLNYRLAFLSAKPVRQAFIRIIELQRPETPPEKVAERRTFIDYDFSDYVVLTLNMDGTDRKKLGPIMQLLTTADPKALKTTSYIERKDGKRVALMDYRAPIHDGLGAKFIFPRALDGKPFIDPGSGEVRVYIELGKTKLSKRFKVSDMIYDGKLEY